MARYCRILVPLLLILSVTATGVSADSKALFVAVGKNDIAGVRSALDEDQELVGSVSQGGMTPLHIAAARGHREIALLLLERGADVNARTIHESTPLAFAVVNNHADVAELLKEHGGVQ